MKLTQVARTACDDGGCPAIFVTDRDTVVVQGYFLPSSMPGIAVPDGEALVEIPRRLLAAGASELEVGS